MSAGTHSEPAGPVYEDILLGVEYTKVNGSTRQRFNIEMWEPAFHAHRPGGPSVGDACQRCGNPWPCRLLVNLLDSDVVAWRDNLS
jgi:hypothetical protein